MSTPIDDREFDLHVRGARMLGRDAPVSIGIRGGRIEYLGAVREMDAREVLAAEGQAVLPTLLEPHVHLDKALLNGYLANGPGTLEEAIRIIGELKRGFARDEMGPRAMTVALQFLAHGTTGLRVHTDVDPLVGTLGVEVMLDLEHRLAGAMDVQIVAFPQEGILNRPGTATLLERSLDLGADVMGACPYVEDNVDDARRHLDIAFAIADGRGLPLDIHADFADDQDDPRFALATDIAAQTARRGMEGRVTIGHATSLDALEGPERARVMRQLATAGVAVVALPATDLHLGGRSDRSRVRRGIAPLRELSEAGVRVGFSTNNIRNAFTPFGNADTLETALLLAQTAHFGSQADLAALLRMATEGAADIMGMAHDHVLRMGATADLLLLEAAHPITALLDRTQGRTVIRSGRVIVESGGAYVPITAPAAEGAGSSLQTP